MQYLKYIVSNIAYLGRVAIAIGFLSCSVATQAANAGWEPSLTGEALAPQSLVPVQPRTLSVERAIRIVRQQTGGRVLAAQPGKRHGRSGVKVRILLDGERVSTLFVDVDGQIQRR